MKIKAFFKRYREKQSRNIKYNKLWSMPHLHVFLNYVINEMKLAKVEFVASAVAEHFTDFVTFLIQLALSRLIL